MALTNKKKDIVKSADQVLKFHMNIMLKEEFFTSYLQSEIEDDILMKMHVGDNSMIKMSQAFWAILRLRSAWGHFNIWCEMSESWSH